MTATRKRALAALLANRRLVRWLAVALVGAAILATGLRLADEDPTARETVTVNPRTYPLDPLSAELARCKAITDPAAVDDACRAAWAENRRQFLGLSKDQERLPSVQRNEQ